MYNLRFSALEKDSCVLKQIYTLHARLRRPTDRVHAYLTVKLVGALRDIGAPQPVCRVLLRISECGDSYAHEGWYVGDMSEGVASAMRRLHVYAQFYFSISYSALKMSHLRRLIYTFRIFQHLIHEFTF